MSQKGKKGKTLKKSYNEIIKNYNKDEQFLIEMLLLGDEDGYLKELNDKLTKMYEDESTYPQTPEGEKELKDDASQLIFDTYKFIEDVSSEFNKNNLLTRNQNYILDMIADNLFKAKVSFPIEKGTIRTKPENPTKIQDIEDLTMEKLANEFDAMKQEYAFSEPILRAVENMNKNRVGAYEDFLDELTEENLKRMSVASLNKIITELQKINPKIKGTSLKKPQKISNIRAGINNNILKNYYKDNEQVIKDIEELGKVQEEVEVEAELSTPEQAQVEAMKGFKTRQQIRKIIQAFKTDNEGNLVYSEATKQKKPVSTIEATDSLNKILSSQMELDASKNAFKTVKENKSFKEFSEANKMNSLNTERKKFKPTQETALKALTNPNIMEDIGNLYKVVYGTGHTKTISIKNFNALMEDISKLDRVVNADQLEEVYNILDTMNNKQYQANLQFSKDLSEETAKPPSISQFGEIIKTKPVKLEDVKPTADKQYQEIKKALREAQKAYDIQEIEGYETEEAQQEALKNIQTLEDTLKKLQPEAKKEQQKKKRQEILRTQGEKAKGAFRPHFKNITEKLIDEELSKTPQEVLKERSNWFMFDVPDSYTGTGNVHDNPLLAQIQRQDNILSRGLDFDCWQESYQLHEGIFERKDFWHSGRPVQTKEQRTEGIKDMKFKEEEEAYLQFFNSGYNALFPQQQTRKEHNDFKNIYQKPSRFIGGSQVPKFQDTNNQGIKYTDNEWINNLNLFINQ